MNRRVVWLAVLGALGCRGPEPTTEAQPPPPPIAAELSAEAVEGLERSETGLPVLATYRGGGAGVQLAYDATLDDPIARWGQCLDRVMACYSTNDSLVGCLGHVERCPEGSAGGEQCCPEQCLTELEQAIGTFAGDEALALQATLLQGDCVDGFAEMRDEALAYEEAVIARDEAMP